MPYMSTFPAGGAGGAVYSYVHTDRASATRRAGNRARANAGGVWPINTRIPSAQKSAETLGTVLRLTRLAG